MFGELVVVDDVPGEFAERVIEAYHGRPNDGFSLCLSGGSTARACYERLADDAGSQIDWWKVDVYWGDERCVPLDDEASNYRLGRESLLERVGAVNANYPMRCDEGADPYQLRLGELGRIDVVHLGMGADCHTASLFPGSAGLDADPGRLAVVQARRAALRTLTRKYGEDVDEVLEWSRSAARRLEELIGAEDRVDGLAHLVQTLGEEVVEAALELSEARRQAARELAARVTAELAHLAMGRARLEVRVEPVPDSGGVELRPGQRVRLARHGADEVEILLAANAGAPPRSLAKSASGGELSRVMLALEVVGASRGGPPTFVFDEVDAGVGGRAALDVGARLARLAEHAQVIVVTHLAQVAAFADRHLVVSKSAAGSVTSSSVALVEADERLRELSRMMGGDPDSEAGLAHALDLLEQTAGLRMPA